MHHSGHMEGVQKVGAENSLKGHAEGSTEHGVLVICTSAS